MRLMEWLRPKRTGDVRSGNLAAFRNLMFTAEQIAGENQAALPSLIAAILRLEQSELILGVAERGNDAMASVDGFGFFCEDFRDLLPDNKCRPVDRPPGDYPLHLGRDPILTCPWNDGRFVSTMSFVGTGKVAQDEAERRLYGGKWRQDNHRVILWLPWRIGFVAGGNHSLAAGIIAGEGSLIPDRVDDFSCLLDLMVCDGTSYCDPRSGAELAPVTNVRHAAVFEIGRLIAHEAGSQAVSPD